LVSRSSSPAGGDAAAGVELGQPGTVPVAVQRAQLESGKGVKHRDAPEGVEDRHLLKYPSCAKSPQRCLWNPNVYRTGRAPACGASLPPIESAIGVDAVLVQALPEHFLHPGQVVKKIERVLRYGGLVCAETPFLQQVHAGSYDFVRYTSSGHRYLFRAFEEVAAGPVAGPGAQLLWSVDHIVRGLLRSELAGKLARGLFFWLRYLEGLLPTAFAMDNASAYYFLGRRAGRQLASHEIVDYYRGAQRTGTRARVH
jgi:hypothetical protein